MKNRKTQYREFSRNIRHAVKEGVAAYAKEYVSRLSDEDVLRIKIGRSNGGKICSFSIRYVYYQDADGKDVLRIDADQHERPHIHIFDPGGLNERKQILAEADGSNEKAFRTALEYIKHSYKTYKDNYIN